METSAGSRNAKYASVYSRSDIPVCGYAVLESLAFVELSKLLIYCLCVAEILFFGQKKGQNSKFNLHDSACLNNFTYLCSMTNSINAEIMLNLRENSSA